MKLLCIIAAAMALVVASSTAMAAPKKQSLSNKATHRMKSHSQCLRHFVNGLPTIQHPGNTRNSNAKVGTKQIVLDAFITKDCLFVSAWTPHSRFDC